MALDVTITYRDRDGQKYRTYADVTFDSSLAVGGESLTPTMLGLTSIHEIRYTPIVGGYAIEWIPSTEKLTAYQLPSLDGNARSASALDEADGVDLDSIGTVKVVAIGF